MEPRVIGICGNGPGAGKTTIAEHLRDVHGYAIVKFARTVEGYAEGAAGGGRVHRRVLS